MSVTLTNK